MRIGVIIDESGGIDGMAAQAEQAASMGFATAWASQTFGVDTLTALAVVGTKVAGIELGTAVVPTYPRHPLMLAQQALTTQAACGGRLVLGIGLSHQMIIEGMFGYSFDKPARHMREYLSVLVPVLSDGTVSFEGETTKAVTFIPVTVPGADPPPPVLLAALAPRMLELAGSLADGTVTWMTGPATVEGHITPSITKAAEAAARPAPRIAVSLPVCVTADVDQARATAAETFAIYGQLPSYRAMLDREGASGPQDVAIVGDEDAVLDRVRRMADTGATDFGAAPFGTRSERERTTAALASLTA